MPSAAYSQGLKLSSQGRHLEAIAQFEQALAAEPGDTGVLFALGNTAGTLGMGGAAEQFYRQVLHIEPGRIEALVNLANLMRSHGQFEAAIALLTPALARMPAHPELNLTLGSAWREKGDGEKARAHYRAALAARPGYAPALSNLADMLCDTGDRAAARTLYDAAIKADPKNPQARLNRAILHLLNGDLKDGWRDYAARTEIPGKVPALVKDAGEQRLPAWSGDSLKKKRLLVRAEQGLGDQILFASLIPDLAARALRDGGSVVLECEPRLAPLLARSFPGVTVRGATIRSIGATPVADYGWLKAAGGANAVTLMGTLPKYLRPNLESFPAPHVFLVPDADELAHWKHALGDRPIGICWRSGKSGGHRAVQYAPLGAWADFLRHTDANFVSVQYDAAPEEIAQLEAMSGRRILVPANIDQKNELDRMAALLAALDHVISAPTAVSWLSAGVGTPTLKMLYDTSWTALGCDVEPFAPACRCLMPKQQGDWADVFAQAKAVLTPP